MAVPYNVALLLENNKPVSFVYIGAITPNIKSGWWNVDIIILSLPVKKLTWILKEEYIYGTEFTMNGIPIRLQPFKELYSQQEILGDEIPKQELVKKDNVVHVNFGNRNFDGDGGNVA